MLIEFKDSVDKRLSRRAQYTNSYKYKDPSDHFANYFIIINCGFIRNLLTPNQHFSLYNQMYN